METKRIKMSIESKCDNVPLVSTAVNKLCLLIPFSENDAHSIELCVTEAVVNSIKHAYGDEPGHEVVVTFNVFETKIVIEVIDTGQSMDSGLLAGSKEFALEFDPKDIDSIPETGRGLAIIQGFMDDVSYHVRENRNYLIMVKEKNCE